MDTNVISFSQFISLEANKIYPPDFDNKLLIKYLSSEIFSNQTVSIFYGFSVDDSIKRDSIVIKFVYFNTDSL